MAGSGIMKSKWLLLQRAATDRELKSADDFRVLLRLCDRADGTQGFTCYPSIAGLQDEIGASERNIRRSISRLVDSGYINADRSGGRGRASVYKLLTDKKAATSGRVNGEKGDRIGRLFGQKVAICDRKGGQIWPPNPERNPESIYTGEKSDVSYIPLNGNRHGLADKTEAKTSDAKASPSTDPLTADFEIWYAAYPRKVARPAALKAYRGARKKTDAATLLAGLETYKATKPDWQQWAYPETWLNGERWLDDMPALAGAEDGSADHQRRDPSTFTDDEWRARMRLYLETPDADWPTRWQAPPGERGCIVPVNVLAEFDLAPRQAARQRRPRAKPLCG